MAKLSDVLDRVFAACAERDGYFTAADMRVADVSDADLHRLVGRGDIERVNRGVYRLVRFPLSPRGDHWAALLWAQPATLSHLTALHVHELTPTRPTLVDLTVPSDERLRKELPALYRLHTADVPPADRIVVSGLSVTSVRRTILDLFVDGEVERESLLAAVTLAVTRGSLSADDGEQLRALLSADAGLLREVLKLQSEHLRSQRNARRTPHALPVKTIGDEHLTVEGPSGSGSIPIFASHSLAAGGREVRCVLIMLHGALRDADSYYQLGCDTMARAQVQNTMVVVPQFPAEQDIAAHHLSGEILRWGTWEWMGGTNAAKPVPISSFSVLDTLISTVLNGARFPDLQEIVLAGHSAGALLAQRYAVLGTSDTDAEARGIRLRYVLANASSYVYFDEMRPREDGSFAPFDRRRCPDFNSWKYGLEQLPAYAAGLDSNRFEARYASRDVTYLLGTLDTNPSYTVLDRSCAALAQGPHRYARGLAYFDYMRRRHGNALAHRCIDVPGVGHDSNGIFTSEVGLAALFGVNRS
jgi:Alpha/beta hydrolase family/Transcriptional regulator, AbiEi antitoxin